MSNWVCGHPYAYRAVSFNSGLNRLTVDVCKDCGCSIIESSQVKVLAVPTDQVNGFGVEALTQLVEDAYATKVVENAAAGPKDVRLDLATGDVTVYEHSGGDGGETQVAESVSGTEVKVSQEEPHAGTVVDPEVDKGSVAGGLESAGSDEETHGEQA